MSRKLIAIFFIFLTLGGNQAKENTTKKVKCLEYDKNKIFNCLKQQLTLAFSYQAMYTLTSFIIFKISIWLAGFSATGPIAGSIAAWIQSLIGNVVAGSIFSFLQAVAMGKTLLLIIPCLTVGTISGLIYLVFSCFTSESCIKEEKPVDILQLDIQKIDNKNKKKIQQDDIYIEKQEEEQSFWSSSFNFVKSGISNTYSSILDMVSKLSDSLPSMPKEVIELKNKVLDSIHLTFDDYVDGMNNLFYFIYNHKEIIQEAFEYVIVVLQEQYQQFQNFQKFIDDNRQSKKENTCMNSFIEYLANL